MAKEATQSNEPIVLDDSDVEAKRRPMVE